MLTDPLVRADSAEGSNSERKVLVLEVGVDLGNWHGVPHLCVPDQLPTYFTKEEFQKFVSRIRKQWFEDLVIVAVSIGMRRGKLLNLR